MRLQMLPRHEMDITITWDMEPLPAGMARSLSNFSPPLKHILDKPISSGKPDTYMENITDAIKSALEQEYPNIMDAKITIICRVSVGKSPDSTREEI